MNARPTPISLPVDSRIPEIVEATRAGNLVVSAAPGTGKTTRVPPALARAFAGKVYVLEPRRLAAKLSCERVGSEQGWKVGEEVGYQFRFERKRSDRTKLVYLTEGMLLREMLSRPTLPDVECVVLDEFHERHLQGDLALALLKRLQETSRPELRLVVMSATLESEKLSAYLSRNSAVPARAIDVPGERYPIEIEYRSVARERGIEWGVRDAVKELLERPDAEKFGDMLVFLPGMGEIRAAESALEPLVSRGEIEALPLHGELSKEEQERALGRSSRTKVILATNIAETSLTIPGVNTVVDAGLARVASYSHWSGLPSLRTRPISKASATQRAGRAGRTAPGRVVRLYAKGDYEGRASFDVPEMERADLAQPALELIKLGVRDFGGFPWFEPPKENSLAQSLRLLEDLGAIDAERGLTAIGARMVELPLHPRFSRALIESERRGCAREMALLIAVLSEGVDVGLDLVSGVLAGRGTLERHPLLARAVPRILQSVTASAGPAPDLESALARALLTGFPERVGHRRDKEIVMGRGGNVELPPDSAFLRSAEYFIVAGVQELQGVRDLRARAVVRSLVALEPDWLLDLDPPQVREVNELVYDEKTRRIRRSEALVYQNLVLSESAAHSGTIPEPLRAQAWKWLGRAWWDAREADADDRERLSRDEIRWALARGADPETFSAETWRAHADELLSAVWSGEGALSALPADYSEFLDLALPYEIRQAWDRLCPIEVSLNKHRKAKVIYEPGQPPRVESRLQDFFGAKEGPSILGGRKKLSLHLLAPNYRAVQVTEDLAGFWSRHYPEIRKELSRRYPRHSWPDDPLTAPPPEPRPPRRPG